MKDGLNQDLAERIIEKVENLLVQKQMSRLSLSKAVGKNHSQISKILNRQTRLTTHWIEILAKGIQEPVENILPGRHFEGTAPPYLNRPDITIGGKNFPRSDFLNLRFQSADGGQIDVLRLTERAMEADTSAMQAAWSDLLAGDFQPDRLEQQVDTFSVFHASSPDPEGWYFSRNGAPWACSALRVRDNEFFTDALAGSIHTAVAHSRETGGPVYEHVVNATGSVYTRLTYALDRQSFLTGCRIQ